MTAPSSTQAEHQARHQSASHRNRVFIALLLLTAGALLLGDQLFPGWPVGDALPLLLGLEVLAWAWAAREDGLVLTGGLLTGLGAGVVLAAGPLEGREATVIGGAWLLCFGIGWVLVAAVARALRVTGLDWAWIPAAILVALGAGLLLGVGGSVLAWAAPVVLLGAGAVVLIRRAR